MKKILLILIPVLLIVAIGIGAVIAFTSSNKTSKNPMKNLRQSIERHDAERFYKILDVDAVLNSAAEEILTAQINSKIDVLAYSTQEFKTAYENLKPDFIDAAKIALDEYVKTGKVTLNPPLSPAQKFFKDSEITSCTIKNFSKPKTEDNETHAAVEFYNAGLNFYFMLDVTLEKIDDAWKITNAKGFENYYSGYTRAMKNKLESINAPIREEIDSSVKVKGFEGAVHEGDEYGFSKILKLKIRAEINSEKPIARIGGNVIIDGKEGREGLTPFSVEVADSKNGVQDFNVDKVLNPFVREDADVMRHGLRKSAIHIEITQLDFADGTTLKEFDELPE